MTKKSKICRYTTNLDFMSKIRIKTTFEEANSGHKAIPGAMSKSRDCRI